MNRLPIATTCLCILALAGVCRGGDFTWLGLDNTAWSNPANWDGGVPPDSDQTHLIFRYTPLYWPVLDVEGTTANSMRFFFGLGPGGFIISGSHAFQGQQVPYTINLAQAAGGPSPLTEDDLPYGQVVRIEGLVHVQAPGASVYLPSGGQLTLQGVLSGDAGSDLVISKDGPGFLTVNNLAGGYYPVGLDTPPPRWSIRGGVVVLDSPPAYFWTTINGVPQWVLGQLPRACGDLVIGEFAYGGLKIGDGTGNFNLLGQTGAITVKNGWLDFNGQFCPEFGPGLRTLTVSPLSQARTGGAKAVFHPGAVLTLGGKLDTGTNAAGTETLVLSAGATVRATNSKAKLVGGRCLLAGSGTVTFDTSYDVEVQHQLFCGETDVVNILKTGSGTLKAIGNNTYPGSTTVQGGTWEVNGVTGGQGDYVIQVGARLGGYGTIGLAPGRSVTVGYNAALAPGIVNSIGTLTISQPAANVVLGGTSALPSRLEIDLTSAAAYDVLALDGRLFLNGLDGSARTKVSAFLTGAVPLATDAFFIIRNNALSAISGTFMNTRLPNGRIDLGGYQTARINYTADFESGDALSAAGKDICLYDWESLAPPPPGMYFPGDANEDGRVDFTDYQIVESNYGTTIGASWTTGDFTGDGAVGFIDYVTLEANFGSGMPEPGALALLALGGLTLVRSRRSNALVDKRCRIVRRLARVVRPGESGRGRSGGRPWVLPSGAWRGIRRRRPRMNRLPIATACLCILALAGVCRGGDFTWLGLDNTAWSNPANWDGGVPPNSDQTHLVFRYTPLYWPVLDVEGTTANSMRFLVDLGARGFIISGSHTFQGQQVPYTINLDQASGGPAPLIQDDLSSGQVVRVEGLVRVQASRAKVSVAGAGGVGGNFTIQGVLCSDSGNDLRITKDGGGTLTVNNLRESYYPVSLDTPAPSWGIKSGTVILDSPPAYFWTTVEGVPQWVLGQLPRASGDLLLGTGVATQPGLKIGGGTGNFNLLGTTGSITVNNNGWVDFNGQFCPEFGPELRTLTINYGTVRTGGAKAVFHPGAVLTLGGKLDTGTSPAGTETLVLSAGATVRAASWEAKLVGSRCLLAGSGTVTFDTSFWHAEVQHQLFCGATDAVNVLKTGSGWLKALGNNTYPGSTTVQAGTWEADGTASGQGDYIIQGGACLGGYGTIGLAPGRSVTVNADAALAPGIVNSIGTLTISQPSANVVLGGSSAYPSRLEIDLTSAAAYDALSLDGQLFLSGLDGAGKTRLSVYLTGAAPLATDAFFIIRNSGLSAISGTFLNTFLPNGRMDLGSDQTARINYTADFELQDAFSTTGNDICLYDWEALTPPKQYIPGDANQDDRVDFTDYQILESNYGTTTGATWRMGDFDGEGSVNFTDYALLEVNFGSHIPEPGALALLALGGLALIRSRR